MSLFTLGKASGCLVKSEYTFPVPQPLTGKNRLSPFYWSDESCVETQNIHGNGIGVLFLDIGYNICSILRLGGGWSDILRPGGCSCQVHPQMFMVDPYQWGSLLLMEEILHQLRLVDDAIIWYYLQGFTHTRCGDHRISSIQIIIVFPSFSRRGDLDAAKHVVSDMAMAKLRPTVVGDPGAHAAGFLKIAFWPDCTSFSLYILENSKCLHQNRAERWYIKNLKESDSGGRSDCGYDSIFLNQFIL